jgi:broad specificity phosphatase PhoE
VTRTILWMRHGTCADGQHRPGAHARPASPLTPLGTCQATRAADGITGNADAIVSSTLIRARSTARIVADRTRLALLPADPVFDEWHAPECVLGLAPPEYPDDYEDWRRRRDSNPDDALPGGESLTAFRDRALSAIQAAERLERAHGRLVIVSHRLLIGAVTALRSGTRDAADVFQAARAFTLKPAAIHAHDPEGSSR